MPLGALFVLFCAQGVGTCKTYLLANPAPALFIKDKSVSQELAPISLAGDWTEAIPSWNVDRSERAQLTVEARVVYPGHTTKYYSFGDWSGANGIGMRASVKGQKDEDGTVLTDTLRMNRPGGKIQFRLTGRMIGTGSAPRLTRLFISVAGSGLPVTTFETRSAMPSDSLQTRPTAWGTILDPPQRAQGDYPGGKGLCSPTSVSMILTYWSARLGQRGLAATVPQVQSGVFDRVYDGAGNWAFNTAYAGSKPGLLGYAARLNGIEDLEAWIDKGVPVVCSVSWYLLHGEALQSDEEGHLVVLDGFTPAGDPVFNDPGTRGDVRKTYKRSDFLAAWGYSKHTVYIICPPKFVDEADVETVNAKPG